MDLFPLFANLKAQPCLVVGGGEVAARKARELAAAGARISVNAPHCCRAMLELLAAHADFRLHPGPFEPGLVAGHVLVIAATSDPAVNRAAADAARAAHRLCNVVDDGAESTFIVPAVVNRSPVIVAVSSGGQAPVLARLLRQQLEQWLPSRLGRLAEWAGGWRQRIRQRVPDIASRRALWERLLAGPAAAAVLSGDEGRADAHARALLDRPDSAATSGKAWLVGAGPGDPGLISVRGLRIIEQADVVLHDRLVAPELLRAARREAEIICVGKTGGGPSASQDDINDLLVRHVRAGRKVCRLKGGDPLIFGRGGEEATALASAGLAVEIVPGITAASGCAAYAGIPLTHRGLSASVTLVSAQGAPGSPGPDWRKLASGAQTLVVYMGGSRVTGIADDLLRHGRAPGTPAAVVSGGTSPSQQVVTGTLADIGARSNGLRGVAPALLIVGETVTLAGRLAATAGASPLDAECTPLPGPAPAAFGG
jgi:uroporphyrin-III C-methyltransferase/precorrin-2 dehydrogenase/sirohydrochlorin ferrochelatase